MLAKALIVIKKKMGNIQWRELEYFDEEWRNRISSMSKLIEEETSVLDIGCGKMWLKEYLSQNVQYFGCDYIPRDENTIVCDLNKKEFPSIRVDLCFVSGCLEYVEDVDWLFSKISESCDNLILSYCTTDLVEDLNARKANAWKNHMSYDILLNKISSAGFLLYSKGPDIDGNAIMKLKKRKQSL